MDQPIVYGYVPTGRVKEDWRGYVKTEKDYALASASGMAFIIFKDFPFSWNEARQLLEEEEKSE